MACENRPGPHGGGASIQRRDFLKLGGAAALTVLNGSPTWAGAQKLPDSSIGIVPIDKNLSPQWLRSLTERGASAVYRGKDLSKIGMPVGGLCAGQLYLGGDGKLWHWDLFNQHIGTNEDHYAHPPDPDYPIDQGFAVRVTANGKSQVRALDRSGFKDIRFTGEYPIGQVTYADAQCPIAVSLEAFSPFIPLNTNDSSLPATVMRYTVRNTSDQPVEVELAGWMQNAACLHSGQELDGMRHNELLPRIDHGSTILFSAGERTVGRTPGKPAVFEDFEGESFGKWKIEGTAFGEGPVHGGVPPQRLSGFKGRGFADSFAHLDPPQGKLTSPAFKLERPFISFLIGGGNHPGRTCINLLVDGKIVRTATGRNSDQMFWHNWNVKHLEGKDARIEIIDAASGGWGHIEIDQIQFGDLPVALRPINRQPDFGTMALTLLGGGADVFSLALPEGEAMKVLFMPDVLTARTAAVIPTGGAAGGQPQPAGYVEQGAADAFFDKLLRGALGRKVSIAPGKDAQITFLITWCFPNFPHPADSNMTAGNYYAKQFADAADAAVVANYVADNFDRLSSQTRLWHDTWYNSTLPYWVLDRTFANTSILASATCRRWRNGRFWCWEGVGCCIGTCTHVWHYGHAVARLFPDLERSTREIQDLDTGFDPSNGSIGMRGEFERLSATDGQTGTVLRLYREHQMSADDDFLNRNWVRIKKAVQFLIAQDGNDDGVLEGDQPNTLDTSYFGPCSSMSSLYVASLRAARQMAIEVGDTRFASRLHRIADAGEKHISERLWNGEYFIQIPDPKHPHAFKTGNGSFIDQVFGQSWAWQVGLERILPKDKTLSALRALWKYNFTPDVGPYRAVYKPGRWYAMPGEAGLIICTWPHGGYKDAQGNVYPGINAYLNECMNGFEYQVAGHMIWEGMLTEGLAITRALHDRYAAAKRNPWNEVECGDHYARSMASYGVFLALCGYEHHGPRGYLAFAPRMTPGNFKAPFTTARGWGTFEQKRQAGAQRHLIHLKWGRLRLSRLRFETAPEMNVRQVTLALDGKPITIAHSRNGQAVDITFPEPLVAEAGQSLEVVIR